MLLVACGYNLAPDPIAPDAGTDAGRNCPIDEPDPLSWVTSGAGWLHDIAASGNDGTTFSVEGDIGTIRRIDAAGNVCWEHHAIASAGKGLWGSLQADEAGVVVSLLSLFAFEVDSNPVTRLQGSKPVVGGFVGFDASGEVRASRAVASTNSLTGLSPPVMFRAGGLRAWSWQLLGGPLHVESGPDFPWNDQAIVAVFDAAGELLDAFSTDGGRVLAVYDDANVLVASTALQRATPQGDVVWSHPLDTAHTVYVADVEHDADGMLARGLFSGTTTFAPGEPNATTLASTGYDPSVEMCGLRGPPCPPRVYPFVARYADDGALQWVRRPVGVDNQDVTIDRIVARADGGVTVAGTFWGKATFGAGEPTEQTLQTSDTRTLYIAELAADGSFASVRAIGSLGCLDPAGIERTAAGWLVGAQRRPSIGAGCWEDLVIVDGRLVTQPAPADAPTTTWFVAQVLDR